MSQKNNNFKIDLRTILLALLAVVFIYLLVSGKLFPSAQPHADATTAGGQEIPIVTGGAATEAPATEKTTEAPATKATEAATKATEAATAKATEAPTTKAAEPTEKATEATTAKATEPATQAPTEAPTDPPAESHVARRDYYFRNKSLLNSHYEKHGIEMGFRNAKEYEKAASAVINNPDSLYKTEQEDGDHVFFLEDTGEFVVLSLDGYIRTYYYATRKYFDRQ